MEDDDEAPPAPQQEDEGAEGYHPFKGRQAVGVLYKLPSLPTDEAHARLQAYVNGGAMDADLRFVREVYGLANTNGRREFGLFWESPWAEEHVRDTGRKRKQEAQQRAMAVRTYIRRAADESKDDENRFLKTVDRLTSWEDRQTETDLVKTVSRLVQAYERSALTHLLEVLDQPMCDSMRANCKAHLDDEDVLPATVACTLRRSDRVFHLFAATVAAEMVWGDATSGARNTTIYLCKQLDEKRREACMALLRVLARSPPDEAQWDTVGMPLMQIKASFCVARGVLVVMPGGRSATYVIDILGDDGGELDANVKTIKILRMISPDSPSEA